MALWGLRKIFGIQFESNKIWGVARPWSKVLCCTISKVTFSFVQRYSQHFFYLFNTWQKQILLTNFNIPIFGSLSIRHEASNHDPSLVRESADHKSEERLCQSCSASQACIFHRNTQHHFSWLSFLTHMYNQRKLQ